MHRKETSRIPFPHPGEAIREDYLKPLGISVNKLAIDLRVPATRMTEIVNGRRRDQLLARFKASRTAACHRLAGPLRVYDGS